MSDDLDNQQSDDAVPGESEGPVGGERLAEARRELQISVHEIAKELHLDEPKVRALERNEFDVIGAPVFAKGHLKTYAHLVNVDPADVLADYHHLNRSANLEPVISARPIPRRELSPGPWIAVIVAIVVAVSVYWWFVRGVGPEPAPSETPVASDGRGMIVTPPATDEDLTVTPAETGDRRLVEPPATESSVVDEREPVLDPTADPVVDLAGEPALDEGQMHVLVRYSGDCWTEITDATGRRLLFDLGKDGRTVELTGAEPFNVLFGNPGNVSLVVNGENYALPATARPDRPMRLTISGI